MGTTLALMRLGSGANVTTRSTAYTNIKPRISFVFAAGKIMIRKGIPNRETALRT
jgi:hypothetical protein